MNALLELILVMLMLYVLTLLVRTRATVNLALLVMEELALVPFSF